MAQSRQSLTQTVTGIKAAAGNPARDLHFPSGSQGRNFTSSAPASKSRVSVTASGPHDDSTDLSFLPSTVPETLETITGRHDTPSAGALMEVEGLDGPELQRPESQISDNATQQISQSVVEAVARSRSAKSIEEERRQVSQRVLDDEEQVTADIVGDGSEEEDEDLLPDTLEEGESNFLDIASSFAVVPGDLEPVPVDISPTQSQHVLSQYPESQRFKTPAPIGKKRDYNGNILATPAQSRNPFADNAQANGNLVGLSQAFANTQAASSPFVNGNVPELPSDRPSPGIELEKHALHPPTSSPMRLLSEIKRAATEPAANYVSIHQSQLRRTTSRGEGEEADDSPTQQSRDESWQQPDSNLMKRKRARERELRARQQLKSASSFRNQDTTGQPLRAESERPATRRQSTRSLPSSPPELHEGEDDLTETHIASQLRAGDNNVPPSSSAPALAKTLVPATTKRPLQQLSQSFPPTQPSPSIHHTRNSRKRSSGDSNQASAIRVANSQRSIPATQDANRRQVAASSGHSLEVIPASPEVHLVATQPSHSPQMTDADTESDISAENLSQEDHTEFQSGDVFAEVSAGNIVSTVPETSSGSDKARSDYTTAPSKQAPSGTHESEWSSQPIRATPPGRSRKRKRMEEISQEDFIPVATQSSIFDVNEVLALDHDSEIAQALAASQPEMLTSPRKKRRHIQRAPVPQLQIEETNSAPVRNSKARTIEDEDEDDDVENHATAGIQKVTSPQEQQTPARRSSRKSAWDIGDSPKPKYTPKALGNQSQAQGKPSRARDAMKSRRAPTDVSLEPMKAVKSIQEASPDPLAMSVSSTAPSTPREINEPIVNPNAVFVHFFNKTSAYYPAVCLDVSDESKKCSVKWPGYDPDDVPLHWVCSLDLRLGDEVKVDSEKFPRTNLVVHDFQTTLGEEKCVDVTTDIYGHTHVLLRPKNPKGSLPKNVKLSEPVPIRDLYLDMQSWRKISKRPFQALKKPDEQPTSLAVGTATPPLCSSTPTTPSSRSRFTSRMGMQPVQRADGIFFGMAFALSLADASERKHIASCVEENGGVILDDFFTDLMDDSMQLLDRTSGLGFTCLLADRHSRKPKFLQALALGLPCVSSRWVDKSLQMGGQANWRKFLLPAGESDELNGATRSRDLPHIDPFKLSTAVQQRPLPFAGAKVIFIASKNKAQREKRKADLSFVKAMGAEDVTETPDLDAAQGLLCKMTCDPVWLIVSDEDTTAASSLIVGPKIEVAGKHKRKSKDVGTRHVYIADHEFLMQTLIDGDLPSPKGSH